MVIIFMWKQSSETDGHPWTDREFQKRDENYKKQFKYKCYIFFKVSDLRIFLLDLASNWAYLRIESVNMKIDG